MIGTGKSGSGPRKPNPTVEAKKAAAFFVKIAQEYEVASEGYRQQLYDFAQRCYEIGLDLTDDLDEFQRFMGDKFWLTVRQKPKDNQIMKAVLTFAMKANTKQKQTKVIKIAKILDHCAEQPMASEEVAKYINEHGGIESLYSELTGYKNKSLPDDLELLKEPSEDAEGEEVKDEEDADGWSEEEDEPDDLVDEPKASHPRHIPKNAPSDDRKSTSNEMLQPGDDGPKITDFGGMASPPKFPSVQGRFDENKHLLVDLSELGMTPQVAMDLEKLSIMAVVGEPDEWGFRPIIAKSIKQAGRISGLWKKGENEDSSDV